MDYCHHLFRAVCQLEAYANFYRNFPFAVPAVNVVCYDVQRDSLQFPEDVWHALPNYFYVDIFFIFYVCINNFLYLISEIFWVDI